VPEVGPYSGRTRRLPMQTNARGAQPIGLLQELLRYDLIAQPRQAPVAFFPLFSGRDSPIPISTVHVCKRNVDPSVTRHALRRFFCRTQTTASTSQNTGSAQGEFKSPERAGPNPLHFLWSSDQLRSLPETGSITILLNQNTPHLRASNGCSVFNINTRAPRNRFRNPDHRRQATP